MVLMTIAILSRCWNAPFLYFDDKQHVLPAVQRSIGEYFTLRYETFFPVTLLSYRADYVVFGPSASEAELCFDGAGMTTPQSLRWANGLRAMNGVYHVLAGFLLWLALSRLGLPRGLAAFVALVWTGHPMACESVCWIAERKNVLSAVFCFGALLAWASEEKFVWRWPLIWTLYALALMSKPSALGFLPVLFALEFIGFHGPFDPRQSGAWLRSGMRLIIPTLLSVGAIVAGFYGHTLELVDPPGGSIGTALLTDFEIVARYISHVFYPADLSFFYGVIPIVSLSDPRLWGYGLFILLFFAFLIWAAGRELRIPALFGMFWFLGALGPNSNIVALAFWMQDRYAYLATAGLVLCAGSAGLGLMRRFPSTAPWIQRAACGFVALLVLAAVDRAVSFSDENQLLLEAARRQPSSAKANLLAAAVYIERFNMHSPKGSQPDSALARENGIAAVKHCASAARCPDLTNFKDPLTVRSGMAEILLSMNELPAARAALGPLPPPDMQLLNDKTKDGRTIKYARGVKWRGYTSSRLAAAFALRSEISLRESYSDQLEVAPQMALCQQAMNDVISAQRTDRREGQEEVLNARIWLRASELKMALGKPDEARVAFDKAIAILKKVPASCPLYKNAQHILSVAKRP